MQEVITIRRTVNIFIGSSINEFREERHELVGYIYSVSDGFERRYGIRVRPLLCEYADPAMRMDGAHKQEDYNDLIRTKIEILSAMADYADRFAEIGAPYEKIVPVAEKYLVETDVICDYAKHLSNQNDHTRALRAAQRLQAIYDAHPDLGDDRARASLVNLTGICYISLHDYAKAEEYYLKAISLYKPLANKRPDAFLPALASCYSNAGVLYNGLHDYAKAEENYLKAIAIREALAKNDPDSVTRNRR